MTISSSTWSITRPVKAHSAKENTIVTLDWYFIDWVIDRVTRWRGSLQVCLGKHKSSNRQIDTDAENMMLLSLLRTVLSTCMLRIDQEFLEILLLFVFCCVASCRSCCCPESTTLVRRVGSEIELDTKKFDFSRDPSCWAFCIFQFLCFESNDSNKNCSRKKMLGRKTIGGFLFSIILDSVNFLFWWVPLLCGLNGLLKLKMYIWLVKVRVKFACNFCTYQGPWVSPTFVRIEFFRDARKRKPFFSGSPFDTSFPMNIFHHSIIIIVVDTIQCNNHSIGHTIHSSTNHIHTLTSHLHLHPKPYYYYCSRFYTTRTSIRLRNRVALSSFFRYACLLEALSFPPYRKASWCTGGTF